MRDAIQFKSRGCRTCKDRRVKCDETRPVCNRCMKSKLSCSGLATAGSWIFLDENVYAAGQRKRQRGPSVNSDSLTCVDSRYSPYAKRKALSTSPRSHPLLSVSPVESPIFSISPSLSTSQNEQALTYYVRSHIEVLGGWPEIVDRWDNHVKYALTNLCSPQAPSILSLAISAVSCATFARARGNHDASAAGSAQYSKALVKTNIALGNTDEATHDDALLAVMLLSFYENAVLERPSKFSRMDIEVIGARCFAHHEGAMTIIKLRQQQKHRPSRSKELDKLVRRQLMRTLLLRCMAPPSWIQNGARFGEEGYALELDRCIVEVTKLRHAATSLFADGHAPRSAGSLQSILRRSQTLDDLLILWGHQRYANEGYSIHTVQDSERGKTFNRILDNSVHLYPSIGHAGMWVRYRTLRLIVNGIRLRISTELVEYQYAGMETVVHDAQQSITSLSADICASKPYLLGLVEIQVGAGNQDITVKKATPSLNMAVKASTGSLLCWPLNELLMISGVPDRHLRYVRDRIMDLSEIVDDGVMACIAHNSFPE